MEPSEINDRARRIMAINAMLKKCSPDEGGMNAADVVTVLIFILDEMKREALK